MIRKMIRNIIFDIGNVLMRFDWMPYVTSRFSPENIQLLNETLFFTKYWDEFDRGVLSEEEVFSLFFQHAPSGRDIIEEACENVAECMTACSYAIPWISELKERGYRVYYLSNYSEFLMRKCPEVLDFLPYTDGGIFSCRVRRIKPDPEIWRILLETYGLKAEECVFIDDSNANIKEADRLGFHTIRFTDYETVSATLNRILQEDHEQSKGGSL